MGASAALRALPWLRRKEWARLRSASPDEIAAAKAQVDQDRANLAQARKRLDDLMPVAPEDGLIENTFFNSGESVPAECRWSRCCRRCA